MRNRWVPNCSATVVCAHNTQAFLGRQRSLTTLHLESMAGLKDEHVTALAGLPTLTSLTIMAVPNQNTTNAALCALTTLTRLRKLVWHVGEWRGHRACAGMAAFVELLLSCASPLPPPISASHVVHLLVTSHWTLSRSQQCAVTVVCVALLPGDMLDVTPDPSALRAFHKLLLLSLTTSTYYRFLRYARRP
jgi:hypothetical protein